MCGIVGYWNRNGNAVGPIFLGLYNLQHRGEESAGLTITDGARLQNFSGEGLVTDVLGEYMNRDIWGIGGIGHTRYSTSGTPRHQHLNTQPILVAESPYGEIAIAHNGNLTNELPLKAELKAQGAIFRTTSDTEAILHLITRSGRKTLEEAVTYALTRISGAYSLVILSKDQLIVARDPNGFRPLALGQDNEGSVFVVSETSALNINDARYVRDVQPGEILVINNDGIRCSKPFPDAKICQCVFEHVYFARPDSMVFGQYVNDIRSRLGRVLAQEHPVHADIVVPVPDSGFYAAQGYAEQSGIPLRMGLTRNHYVGRSFTQPNQAAREHRVKVKLNPAINILEGKRVALIDDSIVRGTTMRKIIGMMKEAGAKEVHVLISCPPTIASCHYGIDTPRTSDLIANTKTVSEIVAFLGADSMAYLSLEGLKKATGDKGNFCHSCFTGHYPLREEIPQLLQIERRRAPVVAS